MKQVISKIIGMYSRASIRIQSEYRYLNLPNTRQCWLMAFGLTLGLAAELHLKVRVV